MATPHHLPALPTAAPIVVPVDANVTVLGRQEHQLLASLRAARAVGQRHLLVSALPSAGRERVALAAATEAGGHVLVLTDTPSRRALWRGAFARLGRAASARQGQQTTLTCITVRQLADLYSSTEPSPALDVPPLAGLSVLVVDVARVSKGPRRVVDQLLRCNQAHDPTTLWVLDPAAAAAQELFARTDQSRVEPDGFTPTPLRPRIALTWRLAAAAMDPAQVASLCDPTNPGPSLLDWLRRALPAERAQATSVRNAWLLRAATEPATTAVRTRAFLALGGTLPSSVVALMAAVAGLAQDTSPEPRAWEWRRVLSDYARALAGSEEARHSERRQRDARLALAAVRPHGPDELLCAAARGLGALLQSQQWLRNTWTVAICDHPQSATRFAALGREHGVDIRALNLDTGHTETPLRQRVGAALDALLNTEPDVVAVPASTVALLADRAQDRQRCGFHDLAALVDVRSERRRPFENVVLPLLAQPATPSPGLVLWSLDSGPDAVERTVEPHWFETDAAIARTNHRALRRARRWHAASRGIQVASPAQRAVVEVSEAVRTAQPLAPTRPSGAYGTRLTAQRGRLRTMHLTMARRKAWIQLGLGLAASALLLPAGVGPLFGLVATVVCAGVMTMRTGRRIRAMARRVAMRPVSDGALLKDFATIVLRTLRVCEGLTQTELTTAQIHCEELPDGTHQLWLEHDDARMCALFASILEEALGPVQEHRYLVGLPETRLGCVGNQIAAMDPFITSYHPVPRHFAAHRETAEIYAGHWGQVFGPGKLRYTGTGKGRVLRYTHFARNNLGLRARVR